MQIVTYNDNLKNGVVNFIQKIWLELDRPWDPEGRENDFLNISQIYQTAGGEFWVVLNDENEVVGTEALRTLSKNEGELGRLYLDPSYRGKGVGRELVQTAIKKARENGFKTIKLDTSKKLTRAYNLFKEMGFKEVKSHLDDTRPEVFMELNLTT